MSNKDILVNDTKIFLRWLRQRLHYKYGEDDVILGRLDNIIRYKKIVEQIVDVGVIDEICNKYWPNFSADNDANLDGQVLNDKDKSEIRNLVIGIAVDLSSCN